jgi:parallel beta-helix repeat protein
MTSRILKSTASILALAALGLSGPSYAKTISVPAGPNGQERLQQALIDAKPGDVVSIGAGMFELTDGLSLDASNVTVKGAGIKKTILSYKGQKSAGDGMLVTGKQVTLRDFAVQDVKGDGLKAKGCDEISFINLTVEWTQGPKTTNGGYGVYPVSSTNVLIDHVTVRGASDAGIYVGQSKNIIVQNSRAEFNVAGIEIENSYNADVHDNVATHNAGGILVFDMPNLPQGGGHASRVYHNTVVKNDTPNFAPKGNVVAEVPTGTGVMVNANKDVHIFDNKLADNQTTNVMLVAYRSEIKDANYNPLPRDVVVRDNHHGKAGWDPQFPGGKELATALGGKLPAIIWDGASSYTSGGQQKSEPVRVAVRDLVPVLNLNFAFAGADVTTAKPVVGPLPDVTIEEPSPVVLPARQAALVKK